MKHDNSLGSGSNITIFSATAAAQMLNTYCQRCELPTEGSMFAQVCSCYSPNKFVTRIKFA
jgi:hypothetical protein